MRRTSLRLSWILLPLVCLATPACREKDSAESSTRAACQADPTHCRTGSLFEILGMLSEYLGRHGMLDRVQPGLVEGFSPGEQALARTFESLVRAHRVESGLAFEYRLEQGPSGSLRLTSPQLADLVNSFYVSREGFSTLDYAVLAAASREQRLRYLQGAFRRFGEGNKSLIHMANGKAKVATIARVLKDVGCTQVVTYEFVAIPCSNEVTFTPTDEVRERLGIEAVVGEADLRRESESIDSIQKW